MLTWRESFKMTDIKKWKEGWVHIGANIEAVQGKRCGRKEKGLPEPPCCHPQTGS
jgi:hypothetical protein